MDFFNIGIFLRLVKVLGESEFQAAGGGFVGCPLDYRLSFRPPDNNRPADNNRRQCIGSRLCFKGTQFTFYYI